MLSKDIVDETIEVMHKTSGQRDEFVEMGIGGTVACLILDLRLQQVKSLLEYYEDMLTVAQKAKAAERRNQFRITNDMIESLETKFPIACEVIGHFRHHLSKTGHLLSPDAIHCRFCKARIKNKERGIEYSPVINFAYVLDSCYIKERTKNDKIKNDVRHRPSEIMTDASMEGIVNNLDGTACVLVPKKWIGERVRITKTEKYRDIESIVKR